MIMYEIIMIRIRKKVVIFKFMVIIYLVTYSICIYSILTSISNYYGTLNLLLYISVI